MYVYQLKILELGIYLDPVFKSRKGAEFYKSRYQNRNILIKEKYIESLEDNYVYRIRTDSSEGFMMEDGVYSSENSALSHIKNSNQSIVKERLYN